MATRKLSRRQSARKTEDRGKKPQPSKAPATGARAARAQERQVEKEQREMVKETEGALREAGYRVARAKKKPRRRRRPR